VKALEAILDGYQVLPMEEAARLGDIFVTLSGNKHVLARRHFELMKDGAVLSNSGHFNVEIDIRPWKSSPRGARSACATTSISTRCHPAAPEPAR